MAFKSGFTSESHVLYMQYRKDMTKRNDMKWIKNKILNETKHT